MINIDCPLCLGKLECHMELEMELLERGGSVYTFQWLKCDDEGHTFYGEYEEFLNGLSHDDDVHNGYEADPDGWKGSLKDARECPTPRDEKCQCKGHTVLRRDGLPGKGDLVPLEVSQHDIPENLKDWVADR